MKRLLIFPIWTICLSITFGCGNENKSIEENGNVFTDSIDSVKDDTITLDSLKIDGLNIDSLNDNIGDFVPIYRWFGTDTLYASSGASRPLGGTASPGVFHGVTPLATFANLLVPKMRHSWYQRALQSVPLFRYYHLKSDSITNVSQTDTIASGSAKAHNQLKKDEANKCSSKATWILSIISFILGVALTLGAICMINCLKNRKKKSKKTDLPVIQADVISEDDKNDEILRDLIVEK